MPTVKDGPEGLIIVSKRRGSYITHQLSPEGARFLEARYGAAAGSEIDVPTLLELKRQGYAYTKRQRRGGYPGGYSAGSADGYRRKYVVDPPITDPPAPAPTRTCQACLTHVPASAHYCARCGRPMSGRPPAGTDASSTVAWIVAAIIAFVALFIFLSRGG
jgi:hypothetical protein